MVVVRDGVEQRGTALNGVEQRGTAGAPRGLHALRHCPPVHSPLSLPALLRAAINSTSARSSTIHDALARYLAQRYDARTVELFASGTHALTAALRAARAIAGSGRAVALPAFTCYDVATAAIGADESRVILYDVDPDTLAPDWSSFEAALAGGAGVAVIAPAFGFPVDWACAEDIARRHGAVLIEDAAQGAGGEWQGRPIGTHGVISVLSFGRGKGWTGGGGGALLLRTHAPAHNARRTPFIQEMRAAAAASAQWLLSNPYLYAVPAAIPALHLGETRYRTPTEPQTIGDWPAALIMATAEAARHETGVRRAMATRYTTTLEKLDSVLAPRAQPGGSAGYLRYPVRVPDADLRTELLRTFARDGVSLTYPTTLAELPELQPLLAGTATPCPGAQSLVREMVTLPTHSHVRRRFLADLAGWFADRA